jgi:hypothetical protein
MITALASPTTDAIAAYRRDGFAIGRGLFDRVEVESLRDAAMAQVALGPVDGLYDGFHHFGEGDPLKRHPRMLMPHLKPELEIGRLANDYLFDARLRTHLAAYLGEEACAAQSMFYLGLPANSWVG